LPAIALDMSANGNESAQSVDEISIVAGSQTQHDGAAATKEAPAPAEAEVKSTSEKDCEAKGNKFHSPYLVLAFFSSCPLKVLLLAGNEK
jgi:hypothetical protein